MLDSNITPEGQEVKGAAIPPRCKHGYYIGCLRCATEDPEGSEPLTLERPITIEGPGPLNEIGTPQPPKIIDWTRPVQTTGAGSAPVKIICIDHGLRKPVVGIHNGSVSCWAYDGIFMSDRKPCEIDLENVPEVSHG